MNGPDHRHLVEGRINEALQAAWCRCGATYSLKTEKWGQPKYTEGLSRRARWRPEEGEE